MKYLAIIVAGIGLNISCGVLSGQAVRSVSPDVSKPAFSSVLEFEDTAYVSGTLGRSAKTGEQSTAQEARVMLDNIQRALSIRGFTMDDLVSVQVFCTDLKEYDTFNGVYRTYFHTELLPEPSSA